MVGCSNTHDWETYKRTPTLTGKSNIGEKTFQRINSDSKGNSNKECSGTATIKVIKETKGISGKGYGNTTIKEIKGNGISRESEDIVTGTGAMNKLNGNIKDKMGRPNEVDVYLVLIDTGCHPSVVPESKGYVMDNNLKQSSKSMKSATGNIVHSSRQGIARFRTKDAQGKSLCIEIEDTNLLDDDQVNFMLMSVKQLVKQGELKFSEKESYYTTKQGRRVNLVEKESGWYLPIYLKEYDGVTPESLEKGGSIFSLTGENICTVTTRARSRGTGNDGKVKPSISEDGILRKDPESSKETNVTKDKSEKVVEENKGGDVDAGKQTSCNIGVQSSEAEVAKGVQESISFSDVQTPITMKDKHEVEMVVCKDFTAADIVLAKIEKARSKFILEHITWGHLNFYDLAIMLGKMGDRTNYKLLFLENDHTDGKVPGKSRWTVQCDDCLSTDYSKVFLKGTDKRMEAKGPRDITGYDCITPIKPTSIEGFNGEYLFVDKASKRLVVIGSPSYTTAESLMAVKKYISLSGGIECFKGKRFQSDKASQFRAPLMLKYGEDNDITFGYSPPYRQDLNGELESKVKVKWRKQRSTLRHSKVSRLYWFKCSQWIVQVYNLCIMSGKNSRYYKGLSPLDAFEGKTHDVNIVKPFGCCAYIPLYKLIKDEASKKFRDKRIRCAYLGPAESASYGTGTFGYWKPGMAKDLLEVRDVHHCDVKWVEDEMYYGNKDVNSGYCVQAWMCGDMMDQYTDGGEEELCMKVNSLLSIEAVDDERSDEMNHQINTSNHDELVIDRYGDIRSACTVSSDWTEDQKEKTDITIKLILTVQDQLEEAINRAKEVVEGKPRRVTDIPTLSKSEQEKWYRALTKEWQGFIDTGTFEEVTRESLGVNDIVFSLNTLFDIKKDGTYKVRSVVQWISKIAQAVWGADQPEAFSPASKLEMWRMLLAMESHMRAKQAKEGKVTDPDDEIIRVAIDVKQAFLNGEFEEGGKTYYVKPPIGFYELMEGRDRPRAVWKLKKPLYGLPVAGRRWYLKFKALLEGFELQRLDLEACIFYKREQENDKPLQVAMNLHVDDSFAVGKRRWIVPFVVKFGEIMPITVEWEPNRHLGMQLVTDEDGDIAVHQRQYLEEMMHEYNVTGTISETGKEKRVHPKYLPMPAGTKIEKASGGVGEEGVELRGIVGSLLYYTRGTIPAIAVNVSMLSSQVSAPKSEHYALGIRTLQWCMGFKNAGLRFKADLDAPPILIKVDAELGGQPGENKKYTSRGGFLLYLWGMLVHWGSGKHKITSTSTFDSEIRTLYEAVLRAIVMRKHLIQMGAMTEEERVVVQCDNEGTVKTMNNPHGTSKIGYIEFDIVEFLKEHPDITEKMQEQLILSRVMEMVEGGIFKIVHIEGDKNESDLMTKCLPAAKFYYCTTRTMCLDVTRTPNHKGGICKCLELPSWALGKGNRPKLMRKGDNKRREDNEVVLMGYEDINMW